MLVMKGTLCGFSLFLIQLWTDPEGRFGAIRTLSFFSYREIKRKSFKSQDMLKKVFQQVRWRIRRTSGFLSRSMLDFLSAHSDKLQPSN